MTPVMWFRLGLGIAIFMCGWTVNGWRLEGKLNKWLADISGEQVEVLNQTREIEARSAEASQQSGEQFEQVRQQLAAEKQVIVKEVIKYVEVNRPGHCQLSNRWVRIDTASAIGVPEDDTPVTGTDDAAPSGFTDADALDVIQRRNFICREEIAKVRGLQDYIRKQLALMGQDSEASRSK